MMDVLTECDWDVRVNEDEKDDQGEAFCVWEEQFYTESLFLFWTKEETSRKKIDDEI